MGRSIERPYVLHMRVNTPCRHLHSSPIAEYQQYSHICANKIQHTIETGRTAAIRESCHLKAKLMTSTTIPQLETARLLLRPVIDGDIDAFATYVYGDPDVTRYLPATSLTPRERTTRILERIPRIWEERGYGLWVVVDKTSGEVLGDCGLGFVEDAGEVEVLYAFAKSAWGKGIASEAARASVRFGFEQAQLPRIIGLVMHDNIPSRRVLEKCGLVYEKDVHYFGLDLKYLNIERAQFQLQDTPYTLHKPTL